MNAFDFILILFSFVYAAAVTATLGLDPDLVRAKVIGGPKDDRLSAYL